MRMKIPVTGTVKEDKPYVSGDPDDPIRIITLDLGNISWKLIELDLENELMEIEVTPNDEIEEEIEPEKWIMRKTTQEEKQQFLEHAKGFSLEKMSKQALYALSKSPRLKNPFKGKPKP